MCRRRPACIHYAVSTKGPTCRRHKACGHQRSALAGNAGICTGRIQPGRVHDKRLARHIGAKPLVEQAHAIETQVRIGARARSKHASAAAHGQASRGDAGYGLANNAGPVRAGVDRAAVHHQRLGHMDPALRTRRRERARTAKRKAAPYLHAAHGNVCIGHARLDHGVLADERHHQVAIGADGLARIAG